MRWIWIATLAFSMAAEAQYLNDDDERSADEAGWTGINALFYCTKASKSQLLAVNQGVEKAGNFLRRCYAETENSHWCDEVMRPNPESKPIFECTYGANQPHLLIDPDESTWKYAIRAVNLVREMESKTISVLMIYNWWRPEPYNSNVSGSPSRHPFGTSVDVRFVTLKDMETAHKLLCDWRSKGRIRAVGYYGTTGLHFGVGDRKGNTWGKACN
jgi:hypothetical protein